MIPLTRLLIALISALLALLTGSQAIAAETGADAGRLTAEQLDYYVIQAFHAATAEQRIALNHIGIQGQQSSEGFQVTSVLEAYPAHRAGINRGDIITTINGERFHPVSSFNSPAASGSGFDEDQRSYELSIDRGGDSINLSVTPVFENLYDSMRAASEASLQQFSAGNKVIGYVHLWALSRSSNDLISSQRLFAELAQCDGIILDLRDSFGFIDPEHLQLILPGAAGLEIDQAEGWLTSVNITAADIAGTAYRRPVAVLVNARTRGGPELLALELSQLERVYSMGSTTPGRIGNYTVDAATQSIDYEPATATLINGEVFEAVGVDPEVAIEFPLSDVRRDDPQFEAAINLLLGVI